MNEKESDSLPMSLLDSSPSLFFNVLLSFIISVPSSTSVWVKRKDQRVMRRSSVNCMCSSNKNGKEDKTNKVRKVK